MIDKSPCFSLIYSQTFGSLALFHLGHPGSPRGHHVGHSEALTLADRIHYLVDLFVVQLRVVPLAVILSNLFQGGLEILVLLKIKLAITIDVGFGPGFGHLFHLLYLEVLVRLKLLQLGEASVFLLLCGRVLPALVLGCGERVDLGHRGLGKGCCSFCHMVFKFLVKFTNNNQICFF